MNTYGIYEQRLNRTSQNTLKILLEAQSRRRREHSLNFRFAVMLFHDVKTNHVPWNPADDGFVFSHERVERQFDLFKRLYDADKLGKITATDQDLDEFFAKDAA